MLLMDIAFCKDRSVQVIDATFDLGIVKFLPERLRVHYSTLLSIF